MFAGPNTQFKIPLRRRRQELFKAGNTSREVYDQTRAYKLAISSTGNLACLGPYQKDLSDITNIPAL